MKKLKSPMPSPRQVAPLSPNALKRRPLALMVSALLLSGAIGGAAQAFQPVINLSSLNGNNGFRLDGVAADDRSGLSVSAAGDINGDGLDDLIIGAFVANPNGINYAGSSYVVFGRSAPTSTPLALSSLNGSNGFRLDGVAAVDFSGRSVSAAGDINGDGIDDLIVGASGAGAGAGRSYVVFGRRTATAGAFAATLALSSLNGSNGFRLDGVAAGERSGLSVSAAGDITGDGIDDLIIGAYRANSAAGSSYVVFGQSTGFAATLALSSLNGSNGFRLDGVAASDRSGQSVSVAGDINGDGIDDLIIGAPGPSFVAGRSYVVFGQSTGFAATLALSSLNGSNGFRLDGVAAYDRSGNSVSAAGDINGDGIDDLIVAASTAAALVGRSYVVFGRRTATAGAFAATLALSSLNGSNGFRLDGVAAGDRSGTSVSDAGDINGDGIHDLIVGAYAAGAGAGRSYVVFGQRDLIFRDGAQAQNIVTFTPRLEVRNNNTGSAVRWQNGATCNCDFAPFDFNLYNSGGNLAFFWPLGSTNGGVASGTVYSVLQPGAVIGPASTFSASQAPADTANWRAGVTGFLGFRFVNANGVLNYGYARIRTTAPAGYPVEVIDFGVNISGLPVTIPAP